MSWFEIFLTGVGLSMDAFAVSIGKGLSMKKFNKTTALTCGLWFGIFQALMPLVGFMLGFRFQGVIRSIDHWIAFVLLALIGGNMIREAFSEEDDAASDAVDVKTMFILAVATSIDALAVGVTYAFLNVRIAPAVCLIGVTTFVIATCGVAVGHLFGKKYEQRAEIFGGAILIAIGLKILLEHLFFGG